MGATGRRRILESASPLNIIVTQRQREAVRLVSARLNISQSELVRDAIDLFIAANEEGAD